MTQISAVPGERLGGEAMEKCDSGCLFPLENTLDMRTPLVHMHMHTYGLGCSTVPGVGLLRCGPDTNYYLHVRHGMISI